MDLDFHLRACFKGGLALTLGTTSDLKELRVGGDCPVTCSASLAGSPPKEEEREGESQRLLHRAGDT